MNDSAIEGQIKHQIPLPAWEERLIIQVQKWGIKYPLVDKIASAFSLFGEHSLGWLLLSALGIIGTRSTIRRMIWLELAINTFGAHTISVIIKKLVRRPRPHHPHIRTANTAGKYSFPSSHSSAAAAGAFTLARHRIGLGRVNLPVILPLMIHARLHKGVHYLSDLGVGALLGGIVHLCVARYMPRSDRSDAYPG